MAKTKKIQEQKTFLDPKKFLEQTKENHKKLIVFINSVKLEKEKKRLGKKSSKKKK